MKRATLGVLLRELAMRADEEEEQRTTLARDLSMGGVYASGKLAVAAKTISGQRAEIRDLRARLKAVRPHVEMLCINTFESDCACDECKAHRATDLRRKDWRKP